MPPVEAPVEKKKPWVARHKILTGIAGIALIAGIANAVGGGDDDASTAGGEPASVSADPTVPVDAAPVLEPVNEPADVEEPEPEPLATTGGEPAEPVRPAAEEPADPTDGMTAEQANAYRSAQLYLQLTGFSRQGLIDQLSSEYGDKFPVDAATVAVDALGADWVEQATRSAASYLDLAGFSRQGLIDQLSSEYGDKFTVDEATAGVDAQNADWNEQARRSAESYLELGGFSREGLIDQLSSEYGDKYTVEQATAGVTAAGL